MKHVKNNAEFLSFERKGENKSTLLMYLIGKAKRWWLLNKNRKALIICNWKNALCLQLHHDINLTLKFFNGNSYVESQVCKQHLNTLEKGWNQGFLHRTCSEISYVKEFIFSKYEYSKTNLIFVWNQSRYFITQFWSWKHLPHEVRIIHIPILLYTLGAKLGSWCYISVSNNIILMLYLSDFTTSDMLKYCGAQ